MQLPAEALYQWTFPCQTLSPTSSCVDLILFKQKMRKSHYYCCWQEQLSLAVLSLPLTCGDISHRIRLESGKYAGYSVISLSSSMEILLNSNGGRMGLGSGFPHVLIFFHKSSFLASLLSSSVFLFLYASLPFLPPVCFPSAFFLHGASLYFLSIEIASWKREAPELLLPAFPHFHFLSANSICLIHQHLLKL